MGYSAWDHKESVMTKHEYNEIYHIIKPLENVKNRCSIAEGKMK